ncbi:hypothetical protein HSBAA_62720 [Vreelandella sulfidaeris]|uniref:tRNA uridine(34) hydroxylase N-terminal domain-containing protein n=1 Tax=Vreelandella sulfidaeris TaxID=115553 RepID=A0A455UFA9_9GAMM|nr:hypothetical protein HSBAA_62720 [Halomonas sulfidaeris]
MTTTLQTPPIVVAALYKFVTLSDFEALREPLRQTMLDNDVKGTLLLAKEGINGTVAGSREGIDGLLAWLTADPRLADIDHKESYCDETPFYRTKVKLKRDRHVRRARYRSQRHCRYLC